MQEGKLDPVIGRKEEVEKLILILCRRRKNNPVLIGEAGVGKTAIVEGLAQAIVKGDVPDHLSKKRLISLDLTLMIAGTKYRGQFEERIKAVMDEVKKMETSCCLSTKSIPLLALSCRRGYLSEAHILILVLISHFLSDGSVHAAHGTDKITFASHPTAFANA